MSKKKTTPSETVVVDATASAPAPIVLSLDEVGTLAVVANSLVSRARVAASILDSIQAPRRRGENALVRSGFALLSVQIEVEGVTAEVEVRRRYYSEGSPLRIETGINWSAYGAMDVSGALAFSFALSQAVERTAAAEALLQKDVDAANRTIQNLVRKRPPGFEENRYAAVLVTELGEAIQRSLDALVLPA